MNGVPKLCCVWSHPGNCGWIDAELEPMLEAIGPDIIAVQRGLAFGA